VKQEWTAEALFELTNGYQPACVLMAAAELDVFSALAQQPHTAAGLAAAVQGDVRATTILADALAALGLLAKHDGRYSPAPGTFETLTAGGARSILPMLRHRANCMRSWAQIAATVRSGSPPEEVPSILGPAGDLQSFIEAMEVTSRDAAARLVDALELPEFEHLLDVGGGPGTWTIAFLRRRPQVRATLFDLPDVIPIARRHLEVAGLAAQVRLVGGDFIRDDALPSGADLAWVSAIVHQNSREENRTLFRKVHRALAPGGHVLIRDIVMDAARTAPVAGALFAVNMLVRTPGGGTYSLEELAADLQAAGFRDVGLTRGMREMDSVVRAVRAST
jgi:SAM-dependent methyltransferase